jgi:hypothetical protein
MQAHDRLATLHLRVGDTEQAKVMRMLSFSSFILLKQIIVCRRSLPW